MSLFLFSKEGAHSLSSVSRNAGCLKLWSSSEGLSRWLNLMKNNTSVSHLLWLGGKWFLVTEISRPCSYPPACMLTCFLETNWWALSSFQVCDWTIEACSGCFAVPVETSDFLSTVWVCLWFPYYLILPMDWYLAWNIGLAFGWRFSVLWQEACYDRSF